MKYYCKTHGIIEENEVEPYLSRDGRFSTVCCFCRKDVEELIDTEDETDEELLTNT